MHDLPVTQKKVVTPSAKYSEMNVIPFALDTRCFVYSLICLDTRVTGGLSEVWAMTISSCADSSFL